jgi:uncharacterized protein with HEPN domain
MSERDWRFRLQDMLESAAKIERFTAGLDREGFLANEVVIDAVIRNLEIIGVAAHHIPQDLRASLPGIAWHQIRGMRNRLAHDYPNIDLNIVWETVTRRIPELREQLQHALDQFDKL